MRLRHIVALATLALVGGVMTYQAFTAVPPPNVTLARAPTQAPHIEMECVRGQSYAVHYGGHGEVLRRVETGYFC